MKGFDRLSYQLMLVSCKLYRSFRQGEQDHIPPGFNQWITERGLINRGQVNSVLDAFRRACSYDIEELLALDGKIAGTWLS